MYMCAQAQAKVAKSLKSWDHYWEVLVFWWVSTHQPFSGRVCINTSNRFSDNILQCKYCGKGVPGQPLPRGPPFHSQITPHCSDSNIWRMPTPRSPIGIWLSSLLRSRCSIGPMRRWLWLISSPWVQGVWFAAQLQGSSGFRVWC